MAAVQNIGNFLIRHYSLDPLALTARTCNSRPAVVLLSLVTLNHPAIFSAIVGLNWPADATVLSAVHREVQRCRKRFSVVV